MVFLLTDQFTVDSRSQHWFTNVVLNMAGDWVFRCRLLDLGMHSANTEVLLFRVGPTPNSQIRCSRPSSLRSHCRPRLSLAASSHFIIRVVGFTTTCRDRGVSNRARDGSLLATITPALSVSRCGYEPQSVITPVLNIGFTCSPAAVCLMPHWRHASSFQQW